MWKNKNTTQLSAKSALVSLNSMVSSSGLMQEERFFKTASGQYGEGDLFLGVCVPQTRSVAKQHQCLDLLELQKLFDSPYHEARLCAVIVLNLQLKLAKWPKDRKKIFNFYLKQVRAGRVNNWDIVDLSAPSMGLYLIEVKDPMTLLIKLATSKSLWQRRVSIMLTFAFIRAGILNPTITIAILLLNDQEDLLHKAVGWMLREVGQKDINLLREFLKDNANQMPRTMLRYSIEKMSDLERNKWLIESKSKAEKSQR